MSYSEAGHGEAGLERPAWKVSEAKTRWRGALVCRARMNRTWITRTWVSKAWISRTQIGRT